MLKQKPLFISQFTCYSFAVNKPVFKCVSSPYLSELGLNFWTGSALAARIVSE